MSIDFEDASGQCPLTEAVIESWVDTTLRDVGIDHEVELAIRIVDAREGHALNAQYRGKDYATNVLSFPADIALPEGPLILGDVVLCWPVVVTEASEQQKTVIQHCAHLVVHGVLHLLGRDHVADSDADQMEAEEIGILQKLGYPNPYIGQDTDSS